MRFWPRGAAGASRLVSASSGWSRPPRSTSTGGRSRSRSSRRQRSVTRARRAERGAIRRTTVGTSPDWPAARTSRPTSATETRVSARPRRHPPASHAPRRSSEPPRPVIRPPPPSLLPSPSTRAPSSPSASQPPIPTPTSPRPADAQQLHPAWAKPALPPEPRRNAGLLGVGGSGRCSARGGPPERNRPEGTPRTERCCGHCPVPGSDVPQGLRAGALLVARRPGGESQRPPLPAAHIGFDSEQHSITGRVGRVRSYSTNTATSPVRPATSNSASGCTGRMERSSSWLFSQAVSSTMSAALRFGGSIRDSSGPAQSSSPSPSSSR